jgi:hypothetical protein
MAKYAFVDGERIRKAHSVRRIDPIFQDLGDFCQRIQVLTCLFARLLCCADSYIVRLCACRRALKTNENPV